MTKKILLIITLLIVIGCVAALSAFEAHVINVTAHIENALSITPEELPFGTVFPQEKLYKNLNIQLSNSFLGEDRVDDIEYVIKQKPKPYNPEDSEYCHQSWDIAWENFIGCFMDCMNSGGNEGTCWEECKTIIFNYADPQKCYPPLCVWLSKIPDGRPENDTGVPPVHDPSQLAYGRLAKSEGDIEDNWTIDLVVPCFQGMCGQDYSWEEFGPPIPPELEGKTFGCDLWIEVTGISERPEGFANYLVISEVYYDPIGSEPSEEWIEIYNPTAKPVDLSNYKLGDEETQGGGEGMYEFPDGTSIGPGEFKVIANKAVYFYTLYGFYPDFEFSDTNPAVPDMKKYSAWASGYISLANDGDEVLLLDGSDSPLDVVIYEGGSYSGIIPHPGVVEGHSIARSPVWKDTNNCAVDFVDLSSPTPKAP